MRKKGCYHKNRPFRLLVAAALRFVQSYLNDIEHTVQIINLHLLSLNQQEMEITNLVHQQTEIVMRLLSVALQ